jgi:cytoskeletal protein RodZ
MNYLLFLLLSFILAVFLIMLASIWFVNFFTKKYIGERHLILDEIIATSEVPKSWSRKYEIRMEKMRKKQHNQEKISKFQGKSNRRYIKKLDRLKNYVKKTSLVEDEKTRKVILEDLEKVRMEWEENKINEPRIANK